MGRATSPNYLVTTRGGGLDRTAGKIPRSGPTRSRVAHPRRKALLRHRGSSGVYVASERPTRRRRQFTLPGDEGEAVRGISKRGCWDGSSRKRVESLPEPIALHFFGLGLNRHPEAAKSIASRIADVGRYAELIDRFARLNPGEGMITMLQAGLHRKAGQFQTRVRHRERSRRQKPQLAHRDRSRPAAARKRRTGPRRKSLFDGPQA